MDNMFELIAQPASGEEKQPEARLSTMVRLSSFGRICFVAGPCLSEDKEEFESLEYRHRRELFSHCIAEPSKIKCAFHKKSCKNEEAEWRNLRTILDVKNHALKRTALGASRANLPFEKPPKDSYFFSLKLSNIFFT
jgi:hypothetical protein